MCAEKEAGDVPAGHLSSRVPRRRECGGAPQPCGFLPGLPRPQAVGGALLLSSPGSGLVVREDFGKKPVGSTSHLSCGALGGTCALLRQEGGRHGRARRHPLGRQPPRRLQQRAPWPFRSGVLPLRDSLWATKPCLVIKEKKKVATTKGSTLSSSENIKEESADTTGPDSLAAGSHRYRVDPGFLKLHFRGH